MVLYVKDGKKVFDDQLLYHIGLAMDSDVLSMIENVDVKNLFDSRGMTLLHHAALCDGDMIVKYLLEQGCDVDALDNDGNTPLMHAVENGNSSSVTILLEWNADMFLCGQGKENSLQLGICGVFSDKNDIIAPLFETLKRKYLGDSQQIAKILMDYKCPLSLAMLLRDSNVTRYMLDNKYYNVNEIDLYFGCEATALHYAVSYVDLDNVKLLLERGAKIHNNKWYYKNRPLSYFKAGREESYEMLITILKHDTAFDGSLTNDYSYDNYMLAAEVFKNGQANEVEAILKYDFNLTKEWDWNRNCTILQNYIVQNTNPGVIQLLEGRQFDVDATDVYTGSRIPLWYAAASANPCGLKFLFEHGADPNTNKNRWMIWYDFFTGSGVDSDEYECVELFLEYGADVQHETTSVNGTVRTIFDIALEKKVALDRMKPLIKPVIAQVAMEEAMGQCIKKTILKKLDSNGYYSKFYDLCKWKIGRLQKTMINETIPLFQVLTESEEKLLMYAQNHETHARMEEFIYRERHSAFFFVKLMRKRLQKIINIAKLRKKAALIVSEITGISNQDVIQGIVLLLDEQSQKTLCKI